MNSISILTPAWNRGEKLKELFESIIIQEINDLNWIIGDDGSDDNTEIIVNELINRNLIEIIYIKANKRIGKARIDNYLMDAADKKFILWVDSDDLLLPNSLRVMLEAYNNLSIIQKEEIGGVLAFNISNRGLDQTKINIDKISESRLIEYNPNIIKGDATILIPRKIISGKRFKEVDLVILEESMWYKVWFGRKFLIINDIVKIMDRGQENSISHGKILKYCKGWSTAYEELIEESYICNKKHYRHYTKLINLSNFFRYSLHSLELKDKINNIKTKEINKMKLVISICNGYFLYLYDKITKKIEPTYKLFEAGKNAEVTVLKNNKYH
jgi:glycosyltransferase involved in cell wall biosynthesis